MFIAVFLFPNQDLVVPRLFTLQPPIGYTTLDTLPSQWIAIASLAGIANKFICASRVRHLLVISQNSTFVDISQNYEIENRNELWN
jgi:hypothetical protein